MKVRAGRLVHLSKDGSAAAIRMILSSEFVDRLGFVWSFDEVFNRRFYV